MANEPPAKRGLSMVFQSYALYPHMSVRGNIALRPEDGRRAEGRHRPQGREGAAETLNLTDYLDRRPGQLSGGQRQRVAIGRAIVREPKAFLFDEPLSNLDAALRGQMRLEIAQLHQTLATTMIYVTHDQVEAMTMADKIVVLNAGNIEQVGSPLELYNRPANLFVAGFIGSPKMNLVAGAGGHGATARPRSASARKHIDVSRDKGDWRGQVGDRRASRIATPSSTWTLSNLAGCTVRTPGEFGLRAGERVWLTPRPDRMHRFDKDGQAIRN